MHHVAGGPVLDVLPQQTAPVERMPAIENLNFLPDMGRMTPTLPSVARITCSWAQMRAAIGLPPSIAC
ncbi:MAG: hypothetical protein EBX90_09540, partial [Betaproteobacteria bacterium]|nr:hypothetical protein [Betaproteobacteria bacterium]